MSRLTITFTRDSGEVVTFTAQEILSLQADLNELLPPLVYAPMPPITTTLPDPPTVKPADTQP